MTRASGPPDPEPAAPGLYAHVVCAVDGAPGDADAVAVATLLGQGGRTSVVHVAADADQAQARGPIDAAAAAPGSGHVVHGDAPGPALCRWAGEAGADLLVVTSRHPGRWGMTVIGPVVRYVLDHAPCAVLVVRRGEG